MPSTPPTVARYLVASDALPSLTAALAVAEKVRDALQSLSDGRGPPAYG